MVAMFYFLFLLITTVIYYSYTLKKWGLLFQKQGNIFYVLYYIEKETYKPFIQIVFLSKQNFTTDAAVENCVLFIYFCTFSFINEKCKLVFKNNSIRKRILLNIIFCIFSPYFQGNLVFFCYTQKKRSLSFIQF